MTLRISGKNLDIGDALRSQVEARVAGALTRFVEGRYSGHVTVEREGTGFRTDCVLHLASGITLEATGMAHNAYASVDQTADRIEKRLRRYKRRLKDRLATQLERGAPTKGPDSGAEDAIETSYTIFEQPGDEVVADDSFHPAIIAETTRPLLRLSVGEAVMELDLTGAPVVVFLHAGTGRVNVVYRRHDGAIGWIDPPPSRT